MKREIRKKFLEKRKNLSAEYVRKKSERIGKKLFSMREFKKARSVMFYVSSGNEVETRRMIRSALKAGKRVAVPFMHDNMIYASRLMNYEKELTKGAFGIPEPEREYRRKVKPGTIDLVIVPGVAFDRTGGRMGFGGGCYDEFLRKAKGAVFIGLAFTCQIADKLPLDEHDVKMHKIVTESGIYGA